MFVCLSDWLTSSYYLWCCRECVCAIQNINKPQRPEDQIKEAARLVLAAYSLKKILWIKKPQNAVLHIPTTTTLWNKLVFPCHRSVVSFKPHQKTVPKAQFFFIWGKMSHFFQGNVGFIRPFFRIWAKKFGVLRSKPVKNWKHKHNNILLK